MLPLVVVATEPLLVESEMCDFWIVTDDLKRVQVFLFQAPGHLKRNKKSQMHRKVDQA